MDNQTKIKATLFVTGAIIFSMLLASFKVQAAPLCEPSSLVLYKDIQIYKITSEKGKALSEDLNRLNMPELSEAEKVHQLETAFAKCSFTADEEEQIQMDIESLLKAKSPYNKD